MDRGEPAWADLGEDVGVDVAELDSSRRATSSSSVLLARLTTEMVA